MISKELLSEILKECKFPFSYEYNNYNDYTKKIYFYVDSELKIDFFSINVYELAHKCKEWALKHHYKVISKPDNVPGLWEAYVNLSLTSKHGEVADTEPEAIFKACQWILDKELV